MHFFRSALRTRGREGTIGPYQGCQTRIAESECNCATHPLGDKAVVGSVSVGDGQASIKTGAITQCLLDNYLGYKFGQQAVPFAMLQCFGQVLWDFSDHS